MRRGSSNHRQRNCTYLEHTSAASCLSTPAKVFHTSRPAEGNRRTTFVVLGPFVRRTLYQQSVCDLRREKNRKSDDVGYKPTNESEGMASASAGAYRVFISSNSSMFSGVTAGYFSNMAAARRHSRFGALRYSIDVCQARKGHEQYVNRDYRLYFLPIRRL